MTVRERDLVAFGRDRDAGPDGGSHHSAFHAAQDSADDGSAADLERALLGITLSLDLKRVGRDRIAVAVDHELGEPYGQFRGAGDAAPAFDVCNRAAKGDVRCDGLIVTHPNRAHGLQLDGVADTALIG